MARILAATNNQGKLNELRGILGPLNIEVVAPADIGGLPDIPETGKTFEENARLKAIAAAGMKQMPAVADDSGLEVFALDGEPGVLSARYAGPDATDADRVEKLLNALQGHEDRSARFVCVIALATPNGIIGTAEGEVRGTIAVAPLGSGGFGYDPIFIPDGEDQSFGQLPILKKHSISHRGNALREAVGQGLFANLPGQALFEEKFAQAPAGEWHWRGEERHGWWILDGALQIKSLPGTLCRSNNNARNLLLRPTPQSTFQAEVTVTNDPRTHGEQAGLLLYLDDDNYVKLVKENLNEQTWIVLACEQNGDFRVINKIPAPSATVRLTISVDEQQVEARVAPVSTDQQQTVGCSPPVAMADAQIGLLCHGGVDGEHARRAQFRLFRLLDR